MPAGPLTPAENKAPQNAVHFFIRWHSNIGIYCGPRPQRYVRTLARGYCFHASNASAKARLPDKPFSMAKDGAAVVAVDHGDIEPSPLLQQLHIAVLVRVHVRQTDHIEAVVTFTASPASGTLRVCSPCFIRMPGTLRMPPAGKSVGSTATSGCGMTGLHGPAKRFRLSAKHGGRRIPDQNDDGAQMGTMRG
jgi:hypothetical protein